MEDDNVLIIVRGRDIPNGEVLQYLHDCGWWYAYPMCATHYSGQDKQVLADRALQRVQRYEPNARIATFTLSAANFSREQERMRP